jgi:hypothetical protein
MHGGGRGSGAPRGNRNAWKHGRRSAAYREVARYVAASSRFLAAARLALRASALGAEFSAPAFRLTFAAWADMPAPPPAGALAGPVPSRAVAEAAPDGKIEKRTNKPMHPEIAAVACPSGGPPDGALRRQASAWASGTGRALPPRWARAHRDRGAGRHSTVPRELLGASTKVIAPWTPAMRHWDG